MSDLILLICTWLAYFAVHSLLASLRVKRLVAGRWPTIMPAYRLVFNTVAMLFLIPPVYLTFLLPGERLWAWRDGWAWLMNGLAVVALFGFVFAARLYDMAEFLGLRQLREREQRVEDQESFRISNIHRYVRHPWYAMGLVLIWTRSMNLPMLVTALMLTAYLVIGSRWEERKLIQYYGDVYAKYRRLVPGLFPLPGHRLDRAQARALEAQASKVTVSKEA